MKVLLSIKPEFADKIFDGSKKYEYRKMIFKNKNVKKIVVYSSSPVQKVIGEFEIEEILSETPESIWDVTSEHSGITKDFFDEYFYSKEIAHAIKIKNLQKYKKPKSLKDDLRIAVPPQSFRYLAQ